ncbi:hypothetical protein FQR65_LT06562 [Abscondita terminalis]|nr:hypothetical protein FQR65_LT06562 [Abscondita terminalis]
MRIWKETKFLVFLGINTVILQILQCIVEAGPARRSSRMVREVYPELESEKLETSQAEVCIVGDVVYGAEEPVPADQPCLKCKCEPPGVQCETTRCMKKPGCKAIHKPNECCPEYQCECEYRSKIYANGERLETTPGGECKVCYCRGGEVQCAEVSCYLRTDCEGRTVPGQCCPKYDHCPPREPLIDRPYTSQPTAVGTELWISNSTIENSRTTNNYQEITQKMEIPLNEHIPKITIQEIIPEVKEIPITGPPKREINLSAQTQPIETKVTNKIHDVGDSETESSEISEIYHSPPILKIGDQLLVLKKGELIPKQDISTPRPVITVIGAEGLQRGTEDSAETHEITSKNEYSLTSVNYTEMPDVSVETPNISEKTVDSTTSASSNEISSDYTETTAANESSSKSSDLENATEKTIIEDDSSDEVEDITPLAVLQNISTTHKMEESTPITLTTQEVSKIKHDEDVVTEQNPEYPPIPDIMAPQNLDDGDHEPEFLHINLDEHSNATQDFDNRTDHPLINEEASLPKLLLESIAPSDKIANVEENKESNVSTNFDVSKEILEESVSEESGEFTTPTSGYSIPMFSVEDASVESVKTNPTDLFPQTSTLRDDVEVLDSQMLSDSKPHEEKKKFPNKFSSKDGLEKDSEFYKQLNEGLKTTPSHIIDNKTGNEDVEAEAIFRELLDDATSSMPTQENGFAEGREKESALLQRVSEAIMKYQAKESKESLDASILGILREFFSSQYKYYEKSN